MTKNTCKKKRNLLITLQEDEPIANTVPSSVLQMLFTPGHISNKYQDDTLRHQIQVQSYNVDIFRNMHCLDPEDIDKLVSLTGMVIQSS
ncbi:unnamed protein product [Rotaria sordida]|uniref:Uncharacterized protein n=1 Tax=Rotaria sordida TaxID=392033 RepID=A0A819EZN4_9BILA|nr:unnamed protein product [Rotaria sordida]